MGLSVITVAAGGLPVKDLGGPGGIAVTEVAPALGGIAVTKVTGAGGGLGVTFVSATGGGGIGPTATLNGTPVSVVVSNGGLTATRTVTSNNLGVASTSSKTSGKYYYEMIIQTTTTSLNAIGVISVSAFTSANWQTNGTMAMLSSGTNIWSNGVNTSIDMGAANVGDVWGIAIDLDARRGWFRKNGGLWNVNAAANPATGANGVTIAPTVAFFPAVRFASGVNTTDAMTANFGASAFSGAVPSGFTAGWTA